MKEQLRNRVQLAVIAVLVIAIAAMAYKFVVAGSVEPSADGRTAVVLEAGERDFVLAEMRGFVSALQQITAALARDDMKAVAAAARPLGMGAAHSAPVALVGKLPLEFKTLAFSVHRDFDAIALDAESLGDAKHSLGQLSDTLGKCAACHAAYRFKVASEP